MNELYLVFIYLMKLYFIVIFKMLKNIFIYLI